jgi:hypothetical protein
MRSRPLRDHQPQPRRSCPLALVATADEALQLRLLEQAERLGYVAVRAHSVGGCLRVATATGPDLVLLDDTWPSRLEWQLRAHPATRASRVVRVSAGRLPLPEHWPMTPRVASGQPAAALAQLQSWRTGP